MVSTHSRPKAAGGRYGLGLGGVSGFNTQPPEGGWVGHQSNMRYDCRFNTQPPEGGWLFFPSIVIMASMFQHTAARRRLVPSLYSRSPSFLFQHTAARRRLAASSEQRDSKNRVSTHSRPKAAGAGLPIDGTEQWFQHTAARRRLARCSRRTYPPYHGFNTQPPEGGWPYPTSSSRDCLCFNTQPPEGGWVANCQTV